MSLTITRASALTATGLFVGAALMPAGSAFASASCPAGSTLVDTNICEITFTANGTWTPPAGVTKVQALLIGAGGASHALNGSDVDYAGGSGDVQLVELATSGAVTIQVGQAQQTTYSADSDSVVTQGSNTTTATGGGFPHYVSGNPAGGDSGSGYTAQQWYGGGAGAGGTPTWSGGAGVVVNEIDPSTFTLFANDDSCVAAGGTSMYGYISGSDVVMNARAHDCGRNILAQLNESFTDEGYQYRWVNAAANIADFDLIAPDANSGNGGNYLHSDDHYYQLGADGRVTIRFSVPALAATGFDATAPAIAGAALVTAGVVAVARRRKATR